VGGPERSSRGGKRRAWLTAALAVAVLVAVIGAFWARYLSGAARSIPGGENFDGPARTRVYSGALVRIPVSGVLSLVADGPSAWAVRAYDQNAAGGGLYQLVRIDLRTNKVTLRVNLGSQPQAVAAGGGEVWLTTSNGQRLGQLARLDPATGRVIATAHLPAGPCDLVTIGSQSLWTECARGGATAMADLLRLDPRTGRVTGQAGPVLGSIRSISAVPGGIWYTDLHTDSYALLRAGPTVRSIKVRIPALVVKFASPQPMVYGQGLVWALGIDESVAKMDLATGRVVRLYTHRTYDPGRAGGLDYLAVGDGSLWFLDDGNSFGGVLRVSIATGRPLGAVAEPRAGDCGQQSCFQIYATPGAIWVPTAQWLIRIYPARLPG